MTSINVPVEIAEHIIDVLWNDNGALRQCALTCRAWLPRSRLHIFHSIALCKRSKVYAFAGLLDTERSIEQLVQNVEINFEKNTLPLDSFFAVLGHRLPRLLRELSLTGDIFAYQLDVTRRTCLHASLLTTITSLTLQHAVLRSFGDLARFLGRLTHLTQLTLDSIQWNTYGTYSSGLIVVVC
ncbi:hypothetical protein C8T65DRAFT_63318 [Cerioporus squamosus]|nr:hypothetical protein C8T65DRAFT_63318 [Cerioporus squamosus]